MLSTFPQPLTNIFRSQYQHPENRLTYAFLTLIEHLSLDTAVALLSLSGLSASLKPDSLSVSLLFGGGEGNPDGGINLTFGLRVIEIFIENKTWRRPLNLGQIQRHMQTCMTPPRDDQYLFVITADRKDRDVLSPLNERRVLFTTWHDVLAFALAHTCEDAKDIFLLREFAEYLETGEEAWRARMLDVSVLQAHSEVLRRKADETIFWRECGKIVEDLQTCVFSRFLDDIKGGDIHWRYGRICVEAPLKIAPFEQSIVFGIYHDDIDGVKFKRSYMPEFVIFWMCPPNKRNQINELPSLGAAIQEVKQAGFEANLPNDSLGNPWHIIYWQKSLDECLGYETSSLQQMFVDQIGELINSKFFKLTSDVRLFAKS